MFGSTNRGFIFGGTSTGVFRVTQSSSSFSSVPASGASSSPAFGSSTAAFGASSTPAFGSSSSVFGGSSCFRQKPAFGGVGSTPTQTSPFGSTSQPSQPAFGSGLFGSSTPFGASSQPAFGATSTVAFGDTSTPAFGATSMPVFGATSTPAFGSTMTSAFGKTGTAFGASSSPMFGSGGELGASITPAFGASSTSAFASSSTPAFGASSSPSFSFSSSPAFGQSTSAFGGSLFGAATSPFGAQATIPTFGGSGFGLSALGGQRGGSRATSYTLTAEADGGSGTQPAGKLESIAAMPVYKDKSHEELHWEDYQLGDKGGPNPASHPGGSRAASYTPTAEADGGSGTQPGGKLESISAMPVYKDKSHEELHWEDYQLGDKGGRNPASHPGGFGAPFLIPSPSFAQLSPFSLAIASNPFSSTTPANPFSSTTSSNPFAPKPVGSTGFGSSSPPLFGPSSSSTRTSVFGSFGFGQSAFGGHRGGSRVAFYTLTAEADGGSGTQPAGKLESISAMPVYNDKCHEELRWEDYQLGDKGGPNRASQPGSFGAPSLTPPPSFAQSSPFSLTTTSNPFSSTSASPFSSTITSNPFAPTSVFSSSGFGHSAFGAERGGSRAASYTSTAEVDGGSGAQPVGKLESISAMPVYEYKSHEELHWEDYQLADKVGPNPASQPGGFGAPSFTPPSFAQSSPFSSTTASNPFSSTTPANPFSSTTSSNLFSNTTTSNPFSPKCFGSTGFGSSSTPLFGPSSSSMQTSVFGSSGFGQSAFGGQRGGSRVASYTLTAEADGGSGTQPAGNLESISAMPVYKDKSHDELHWEDHQLGDKGGPNLGWACVYQPKKMNLHKYKWRKFYFRKYQS